MLNAERLLLATRGTWKACVEATIPRTAVPVVIFMVSGGWLGLGRSGERTEDKRKYVHVGRDNPLSHT